jgi:hypothetical protein
MGPVGLAFRQDDGRECCNHQIQYFKQPKRRRRHRASTAGSIPESVVVVMVMMMVMVVMPVRDDHDPRSAISVVMVVVMMVILRELDISIRGRRRLLFVDHLQERARIRDRLQELGIGVGP